MRVGSWWTAAVTVHGELLGGLVLQRDEELSEADQRILERAALVTALLLLIRRTAGEAENRVRGELLEELLTSSDGTPTGCGSVPADSAPTSTRRSPSSWRGSRSAAVPARWPRGDATWRRPVADWPARTTRPSSCAARPRAGRRRRDRVARS